MSRTPVINYTYTRTRPIVERMMQAGEIDKRHGARVRYANPVTGGSVLPTMGAWLAMLPKGFKGEPYRATDGTIFVCVEGKGTTTVDGKVLEWGPNDVFVVPSVEAATSTMRREGVGAVLDLRPAGAGSARHLARGAVKADDAFTHDVPPQRVVFASGALARVGEEAAAAEDRAARWSSRRPAAARGLARKSLSILGARAAGLHAQAVIHVPKAVAEGGLKAARDTKADGLIAVGGGSAIGLAKAIALETASADPRGADDLFRLGGDADHRHDRR